MRPTCGTGGCITLATWGVANTVQRGTELQVAHKCTRPNRGPLLISSPALKPPPPSTTRGGDYVATRHTCAQFLILSRILKRREPLKREGLRSHPVHLWATSNYVPYWGFVATRPTCGPLLILYLAPKCWGPLRRQGLCRHAAHLWAIYASVSALCTIADPLSSRGYVATQPTCGPLLIRPPALQS